MSMVICPNCQELTNNPKFCGRSCSVSFNNKKRTLSDETKSKISTRLKISYQGAARNPLPYIHMIHERWRDRRVMIVCGDKDCLKPFEVSYGKRNRKYCSKICSGKNAYHPNSSNVKRGVYKGYKMDSGAELFFAQVLDENDISWIKNTEQSFEYMWEGKERKYYPDFYLPDYKMWVEIKGKRYIRLWDEAKRNAVPGGVNLIISNNMKIELPRFLEKLFSRNGALTDN